MTKFTQDMKDIFAKARPFILATADKNGKPNGVPIGIVKLISDDEIMLVNVGMHKTWQNLEEHPVAAVTFWSGEDHYGYQFKGKARLETSGKTFDEAKRWVEERLMPGNPKPKGVVIVKVDEIYYIGPGHDPSINLAQQ